MVAVPAVVSAAVLERRPLFERARPRVVKPLPPDVTVQLEYVPEPPVADSCCE